MVDWKKLKAEYIAGGSSYRKLSAKYGVPRSNIERRAKAEGWVALQRQTEDRVTAKMVETIEENGTRTADSIVNAADSLLKKIIELADIVEDTQSLKQLTSALKDVKDIKGYKSEADLREQNARIKNLERQAEGDRPDSGITVIFGSDTEEYAR